MEKVKVCVPITGQNQTEIEQQAHAIAATDADVVEWRFDLAMALYPSVQGANAHTRDAAEDGSSAEIDAASEDARQLQAMIARLRALLPGKSLLFTIRTQRQGGSFPNDAAAYRRFCTLALASARLDYLDLEDTTPAEDSRALMTLAHEMGVRVIASYHDFEKTPAVAEILECRQASSGDGPFPGGGCGDASAHHDVDGRDRANQPTRRWGLWLHAHLCDGRREQCTWTDADRSGAGSADTAFASLAMERPEGWRQKSEASAASPFCASRGTVYGHIYQL